MHKIFGHEAYDHHQEFFKLGGKTKLFFTVENNFNFTYKFLN